MRLKLSFFSKRGDTEMQASITLYVSSIDISTQFYQCLDILDQHVRSGEVQSSCTLLICLCDLDSMAPMEDKYRKDALVSLCSTVHYSLLAKSILIGIALKFQHQYLYNIAIASRGCQMNRL